MTPLHMMIVIFYALLSNIIFLFLDVLRSLSDDRGSSMTPQSDATLRYMEYRGVLLYVIEGTIESYRLTGSDQAYY